MQIIRGDQVPESGVSHDPEIRKRVLLGKGAVPKLSNFSRAVFRPGQGSSVHAHCDLFEVYLVESGECSAEIDGGTVALRAGDCLVVEPGECHALLNASADRNVELIYFGIER